MIKYSWVYLCNNVDMLRLAVDKLPSQMDGLIEMVIVVNERNKRLIPAMRKIAPNAFIFSDAEVIRVGFSQLRRVSSNMYDYTFSPCDKHNNSLGVKLLIPLWIKGPILFTDDDVMILRDPQPLLQQGQFCTGHHFNSYSINSRNDVFELEEFTAAMNVKDFTVFDYNDIMMDAGIWYVNERGDWATALERFMACDILTSIPRDITRFRVLDQRFITVYGASHGWRKIKHMSERIMVMQGPDKIQTSVMNHIFNRRTTFVHYGASSWKQDYIRIFTENVL